MISALIFHDIFQDKTGGICSGNMDGALVSPLVVKGIGTYRYPLPRCNRKQEDVLLMDEFNALMDVR